jgi:hypothetical protein
MVTFALNRKWRACEMTASGIQGQGEIDTMGANGPQSVCPKEHNSCLYDERMTQETSCHVAQTQFGRSS